MSFRFKQFFVEDSLCGMKVGTDGVLLGAWCALDSRAKNQDSGLNICNNSNRNISKILDVGTGSGLIALMLAQRFGEAEIVGVDIDEQAVVQAQANFAASPWRERLRAECSEIQKFRSTETREVGSLDVQKVKSSDRFDLIVSNPPYFNNSLKNPNAARSTARHTDTLRYEELIAAVYGLLKEDGRFAVILPIESEEEFCLLAAKQGFFLSRVCRVKGNVRKPFKRVMLEFAISHSPFAISHEELILEEAANVRSEAYKVLTKDFYL